MLVLQKAVLEDDFDDGFVLVGDAAAFMDPFYSPGMDWISFTASAAAAMTERLRAKRTITCAPAYDGEEDMWPVERDYERYQQPSTTKAIKHQCGR